MNYIVVSHMVTSSMHPACWVLQEDRVLGPFSQLQDPDAIRILPQIVRSRDSYFAVRALGVESSKRKTVCSLTCQRPSISLEKRQKWLVHS